LFILKNSALLLVTGSEYLVSMILHVIVNFTIFDSLYVKHAT